MTAKNLSTVATQVIKSAGNTASNVVNAYHAGGVRAVELLEQRWNRALHASRTQLTAETASNAIAAQQAFSGYTTQGIAASSNGAQILIAKIVKLADLGVQNAAANARRIQVQPGIAALDTLVKASLPSALALSSLTSQIEAKSAALARKAAGTAA